MVSFVFMFYRGAVHNMASDKCTAESDENQLSADDNESLVRDFHFSGFTTNETIAVRVFQASVVFG